MKESHPIGSKLLRFDNSSVHDNFIEMTCNVNFSGNWAPLMKWQQNGSPVIPGDIVNITVPYKSVTSILKVLATREQADSTFSCTTYFSAENKPKSIPPANSSANIPDYSYTVVFDAENSDGNLDI